MSDGTQSCLGVPDVNRVGATENAIEARVTGLEPATSGSTVRCSNQLSYTLLWGSFVQFEGSTLIRSSAKSNQPASTKFHADLSL